MVPLKNLPAIVGLSVLVMVSASAFAQGRDHPRGGGGASSPARQTDVDRMHDRTTARDMDRTNDRDMMRDFERDRRREQDRDRVYAPDLMSEQERAVYQKQLRTLTTEKERVEFRLQHQKAMQDRAKQQGAKLPKASSRQQIEQQERDRQRERAQIYGYSLMNQQELDQYRERLRLASSEQQREQIRAEYRQAMQERARKQGVTLPEPIGQ